MAIESDFTIDYTLKTVRHTSGVTVYTVNEYYSWLMDAIDEQDPMAYKEPISGQTPTEYTMINGWFIDDESVKYLTEGAIKTEGYLNEIQVLVLDAYTNCIATDIGKMVTDDAADSGPLLAYDNTKQKWWIRTGSGDPILDGSAMAITDGSGVGDADGDSVDGEDLYANIYTLGTIETTGLMYVCQAGAKLDPDWWDPDGHIDVLIKVKEAGVEIDNGIITLYLRVYTDLMDFYEIDLTDGGRNAVPLATFDDPDNQTAVATVMDRLDTIQVLFANGQLSYATKIGDDPVKHMVLHDKTSHATAFLLDAGGEAAATGTFEIGDVEGTFGDTNDLEICTEIPFDAQTALFTVGNTVQGGTSSATAVVRRITQDPQSEGVKGILYVTDIAGGPFQDNETIAKQGGGGGSATTNIPAGEIANSFDADVNGAITIDEEIDKDLDNGNGAQPYNIVVDLNGETVANMYELLKALTRRTCTVPRYTCDGASIAKIDGEQYQRALSTYALKKASPLGTFAGGKFFGARGVWIEGMSGVDSENYSLIDALGATQDPPTSATLKVTSMIPTNDRVMICVSTGAASVVIKKDQYTMTVQGSGEAFVQVSGAIADDAPPTGTVRVVYDYGLVTEGEDVYVYTSIDRSGADDKFMLSGVTSQAYDADDRAYNPYIDENADASGEAEIIVKYAADNYLVIRVRFKGYIPFETSGQLLETGYLVSAIRTVDGIYTP